MSTLLIADVLDGQLALDQTAKTLTAAKALGPVTVLCASYKCSEAAKTISSLEGVSEVLLADSESYQRGLAEPLSHLITAISSKFTHIVCPATALGKNVMPRVAALLDVMVISDITNILSEDSFERPIYAGNAIQTIQSLDEIKVCTVRTAGYDAAGTSSSVAAIKDVKATDEESLSEWVEDTVQDSDRPELTSAKIVVSGGRGVGSEDDFKLIEQLADKFGAAVGASRAAVDSGYAPNDWQVGQTGKVVAPELYVAIGISGAIQHLAGMKDSKVIVAINKDEEAPIFQIADYGLVADLFEVVPELTSKI